VYTHDHIVVLFVRAGELRFRGAKPEEPKDKVYSWRDVAKHNIEKDCWVSVRGKVYDITCECHLLPSGYT
jgi:cytochrome b involved in lipid metabolism